MKSHTFTFQCPGPDAEGECDFECDATVDFGYPAPPCSNPDSPAYSDPGDPGCVECDEDRCPRCGTVFTSEELWKQAESWATRQYPDEPEPPDPDPMDEWEAQDRWERDRDRDR